MPLGATSELVGPHARDTPLGNVFIGKVEEDRARLITIALNLARTGDAPGSQSGSKASANSRATIDEVISRAKARERH